MRKKSFEDVMGLMENVKFENIAARSYTAPEEAEKERNREKLEQYKTILPILKGVEALSEHLTDWEFEFIHNLKLSILKKWPISEKQIDKLRAVAVEVRKRS